MKKIISEKVKDVNEIQWEVAKNGVFFPCGQTTGRLASGVYVPGLSPAGPYLKRVFPFSDKLLRFEDPTHKTIIGEIDNFWSVKNRYKNLGFLHNRTILMHGPPGSGKTCISKIVMADVIERKNIIINADSIYALIPALKVFREVEPERQCLVLMEDVDSIDGQYKMLSLLDGEDTVDNILYLLTTNFIHKLPERLLRPGRIDRKIFVPCPPEAGRVAFLQDKLGNNPIVYQLARATDGLSFAHLRELLVGIYCLDHKPEDVITRLRNRGAETISTDQETELDKEIRASVKNRGISKKILHKVMAKLEQMPEFEEKPVELKETKKPIFKITKEEEKRILRRRQQ
ncbi:MAG: AAA family ATPase [Candidatus Firestonebacteria bacterium]